MRAKPTIPIPIVSYIEHRDPKSLIPDPDNPKPHTRRQIAAIKKSIQERGLYNPIAIDEAGNILAGYGRTAATIELGMETVECRVIANLSQAQKDTFRLFDNRSSELTSTDSALVAKKLATLVQLDIDVELTGYITGEVDIMLAPPGPAQSRSDALDAVPVIDRTRPSVTSLGDLWLLKPHVLLCGDARSEASYQALLDGSRSDLVIADCPFNVPITGHVSGLGANVHADFAMASGEMPPADFTRFLQTGMEHAARFSIDGSLHYWLMDWRHMREILDAGDQVYSELKALCVWNKSNGGMGSHYRSKHELVFVFKNGTAPHVNNIDLGKNGRYRTNVWDYPGANAFGPTRARDLADHPTVKPVALVADIIRDASKRNALVLDPFAGSGTTILAAERTGRRAAAIEIDERYVEVAIRRWQAMTGGKAIRAADGRTFDELSAASNLQEVQGE